ncbi:MAG: hypothetical protein ACK50A_02635 [Sphingobacteriaceae bacterium]
MKANFFFWGLIYLIVGSSFVIKPKDCLRVTLVSLSGKGKLNSVFVTVVDNENQVKRYNTGKESNVTIKLPLGKQYTLVFTKGGYESKLISINAVPAGLYKERTEIAIDINLARTKLKYPPPKDMGAIFFDEENNLIVKNIERKN